MPRDAAVHRLPCPGRPPGPRCRPTPRRTRPECRPAAPAQPAGAVHEPPEWAPSPRPQQPPRPPLPNRWLPAWPPAPRRPSQEVAGRMRSK
eukprot:4660276-Prymnesium_polylepis.1